MAGIYIHIPFCRQKCHYCNFYSIASVRNKHELVEALLIEIELQKNYLGSEKVETIYLGGGTPSLLPADELNRIFDQLDKKFQIEKDAEITLEANPDDLNSQYLKALTRTPVNRLSVGVQSFHNDDLLYLNRVHSAEQAKTTITEARAAGFNNMSIDLIYGIPTLTNEKWEQNLEIFSGFNLSHLSAYALTVEPKTALEILIKKGKMMPVQEQAIVDHFRIIMKFAEENRWEHYEISNWCKKPFYSKHNTNYWFGKKYLGLGPSAHSYNINSRQWNISSIVDYLKSVREMELPTQKEELTTVQQFNEYIMLSVRTMWGIDISRIRNDFGENFREHFLKNIRPFISRGWIIAPGNTFTLSDSGKLFADYITAGLFVENHPENIQNEF